MSEVVLSLVSEDLRDDVARCAAAAGYRLVVGDPGACRADWLRARAVVADPTAITDLARTALPRRAGVLLVSGSEPPPATWRMAMDLGAADAALLPADEDHLVRALSEIRVPRQRFGGAIALIGAHGGAGASILSAAVALTAVDAGSQVLLLDVDDLGGGLDLALGVEDRPGLRWQDLSLDGGAVSGQALHQALPRVNDRLALLAGRRDEPSPLRADAVLATIDAGRAHGDLVVVDLPRADTAVVRAAVESAELVVLVTAPSVAGCAAARHVAQRLLSGAADLAVVVRGPAPGGLRATQVADAIDLPLLAAYRPDPRLPGRLEDGRWVLRHRSPLAGAARSVLAALDQSRHSV